jgi:thioredoxin reductase (NADPH)
MLYRATEQKPLAQASVDPLPITHNTLVIGENMSAETSQDIIVYGTTWCPDCRNAKNFLGEHRIQYVWVDIEQDATAMAEVERLNHGRRSVPTILFPDGGVLVEPTDEELARKLGLRTVANRSFYDLIVIGGGPAGLTTSIYGAREGMDILVIEKRTPGGQAASTQRMENYPGFDEGISGIEFGRRLTNQAKRFGVEILQATSVDCITREGRYRCVQTPDGNNYTARAVLIATGSRYRWLNVPGERVLIGSAIHFCAVCDGPFYKDKEILVVGGGNSGFQEGLFLTRFAKRVTIVEYLPEVKASKLLQDAVAERKDMNVITNHEVKAFHGERGKLLGIDVMDRATGKVETWKPDGVFIFAGLNPNTEFLPVEIERDRFGFIQTDLRLETTMPGVFAAGDCRAGSTKQAAAAAGEGATAALMIREYLQNQ